MFNLSLTEKASFAALVAAFLLVCLPFGLSYARDEPFVLNGKEFGFGSNEYKRVRTELAACQQTQSKAVSEALSMLEDLRIENQKLREANLTLIRNEDSRNQKNAKMWFPVDDVTFYADGKFVTQEGITRKGKWTHQESELSLRLLSFDHDGIVFATNLPAPGNFIRLPMSDSIFVPMRKWDYRLSVKLIESENVEVRIERQNKS